MPPTAWRRDFEMAVGVLTGVALVLGGALYYDGAPLMGTLMTFVGVVGTLFGFALLNTWLTAARAAGTLRVAVNLAGVLAMLLGIAASDLFLAAAGTLMGAAACLAAATSFADAKPPPMSEPDQNGKTMS